MCGRSSRSGGDPPGDLAEIERLWEADASKERKEILARHLAQLTVTVRAAPLEAEAARLEQLRVDAVEWRIQAELASARPCVRRVQRRPAGTGPGKQPWAQL